MSISKNGLLFRPALPSDAGAVAEMWNRRAASRGLAAAYAAADLEHRWATPGVQLSADTYLAWQGSTLVGYAELRDVKEPHVELFVACSIDPAFEADEALSDEFFRWFDIRGPQSLSRAPADARVILVSATTDADARRQEVLARHGLVSRRTFHELRRSLEDPVPEPGWPEGARVRTLRPGEDDVEIVAAYREAFANHYGYLEQPFDVHLEWRRDRMKGDDFEAGLWFLAMAGDGVCGFCTAYATSHGDAETGLIDEFGVRPAWRRRGVGRALLCRGVSRSP